MIHPVFAPENWPTVMDFTNLQSTLRRLDHHFKADTGKSVNRLLTMRNGLFGFYIVEFQQHGDGGWGWGGSGQAGGDAALKA